MPRFEATEQVSVKSIPFPLIALCTFVSFRGLSQMSGVRVIDSDVLVNVKQLALTEKQIHTQNILTHTRIHIHVNKTLDTAQGLR